MNYSFAPQTYLPFEEEHALVEDLMQAIEAPPLLNIDMITKVVDGLADRQQTRKCLCDYVDLITAHPELSYDLIRLMLAQFADSCVPPITHMQARALAFVEKRRRAEGGDAAAKANIDNQPRYRWRLSHEAEEHLWRWMANRWAAKQAPQSEHNNLLQELVTLSNNLGIPQAHLELWVRTVILAIVKMQRGGVKITGLPVRIVVKAAIDDTAPF